MSALTDEIMLVRWDYTSQTRLVDEIMPARCDYACQTRLLDEIMTARCNYVSCYWWDYASQIRVLHVLFN